MAFHAPPRESTTPWGAAWRLLRHGPDRLRHPRRRDALAYGLHVARPRRVITVCYGNICRSPFAAALLVRTGLPAKGIAVLSAGFVGGGRGAPPLARAAARRHGVRLEGHRSQLLSRALLAPGDLVVAMEPSHERVLRGRLDPRIRVMLLGDLDPEPIRTRAIPDPVLGTAAAFEACYARIARCVAVLARLCLAERETAKLA